MIYVGVDIGSVSTDVILLDESGKILSSGVEITGKNGKEVAEKILFSLLRKIDKPINGDIYTVSTGYGRKMYENAEHILTEITCHAIGARYLFPHTDTVLDIGGQDSKAMRLNESGLVTDFQMNDRCAAGTGRFIEVMASGLELNIEEMNLIYYEPGEYATISATCTVFAESEIISLINDGTPIQSVVKGLFKAVAERSIQLLSIINPGNELTLTGGVAKNKALVEEIKKSFPGKINLPYDPQIIGALGAALMAMKYYKNK